MFHFIFFPAVYSMPVFFFRLHFQGFLSINHSIMVVQLFLVGKKGRNWLLSDIGRRKKKCPCDRLWCIHCVSYVKTENAVEFTRLHQFSPKKKVFEFYKNNSLYSCAVSYVMARIWLLTKRRMVNMKLNKIK